MASADPRERPLKRPRPDESLSVSLSDQGVSRLKTRLRAVLPSSSSAATSSPSPLRGTVEFLDAWLADPHSPPVDVDYVSELVEDYIARLSGRLCLPLDADSLRQLRRSHPILKYCLVYGADLIWECSHDPSALLVSRMSTLRRLLWSFGASRCVRLWCVSLSD